MTEIKIPWDLKNWIISELRKRVKRAEAVLSKPEKYDIKQPEKLRDYVVMANRFIEWVNNISTQEGKESVEFGEEFQQAQKELQKKLEDLALKVDQLEIIVKKLAAYHQGDVS